MSLQLIDNKLVVKGKKRIVVECDKIDSIAFHLKSNKVMKVLLVFYLFIFSIIFFPIYIPISAMVVYLIGLFYLLFFGINRAKFYVVFKWKEKKVKMLMDKEDLEITFSLIDSLRLNKFKKYTAS
ncbi:hypothetical protein [Flavobacterium sp.]|uniref:hypothetical protein n=1 Tax=Flavobacterium sp. TaxID=239 RepID=UPI0040484B06